MSNGRVLLRKMLRVISSPPILVLPAALEGLGQRAFYDLDAVHHVALPGRVQGRGEIDKRNRDKRKNGIRRCAIGHRTGVRKKKVASLSFLDGDCKL